MGLPRAIQFHQKGDLQLAERHYERAYQSDEAASKAATLYLNYGALLRSIGKSEKAEKIYKEGLTNFPGHVGILNNYCNLMHDARPCFALAGYVQVLRHHLSNNSEIKEISNAYVNISECFYKLDLKILAKNALLSGIYRIGVTPDLLRNLVVRLDAATLSNFSPNDNSSPDPFIHSVLSCINDFSPVKKAGIYFAIASLRLSNDQASEALSLFRLAYASLDNLYNLTPDEQAEAQSLVDMHGWNFSCSLLKQQYLTEGWKLFEFGLRTPAVGLQKWQRALKKPFTAAEVNLWRGESLNGKHLLVIEEQGIGDGMMFLSLINTLVLEAETISILINSRLFYIYKRSFADQIISGQVKIYTHQDFARLNISHLSFDCQIPLGSICQHRFTSIQAYAPVVPILRPDTKKTQSLKSKYIADNTHSNLSTKLIGISWRGGGRPDRIKAKSIELDEFTTILKSATGCRFIILQYGDCDAEYRLWQKEGIDVVYDRSINPLKDMDNWLNQVAACDAVLSVANTTIHGAGGLNIPTFCLLGLKSDWRWFDDSNVLRSYWYPSVGILRRDPINGWQSAITKAESWLANGTPYPTGAISTHVL